MRIRTARTQDLAQIAELQPENWSDIMPFFRYYLEQPCCNPFVVEQGDRIVAVGNVMISDPAAWISHIIVSAHDRGQGIGKQLVTFLVKFCQEQSVKSIALLASNEGQPLYEKFGFQAITPYVTYLRRTMSTKPDMSTIVPAHEEDRARIYQIDAAATGENRQPILASHVLHMHVFKDSQGMIQGYYAPAFFDGPVVAMTEEAGTQLLCLKHQEPGRRSVMPIDNQAAHRFMQEQGYEVTGYTLMRMVWGESINWQPTHIYGQIHGSFG